MRIETYADPPALLRGLLTLYNQGLTSNKLLFLALDSHGAIYLARPDQIDQIGQVGQVGQVGQAGPAGPAAAPEKPAPERRILRVGEKLTLKWPGPPGERLYHYDSIHVLRNDFYVLNGDRRLQHPGDAIEVGLVMANFLRWCGAKNVFFGCTPHQPGSWLLGGKEVVALHDYGVVEILPVQSGLLARRIHDHRLYLLTFEDIARTGHLEDWLPVYSSPLGNVLLLERRVVRNLLVLSCERGLIEVDLQALPKVTETGRLDLSAQAGGKAFAVVGRVDGEAFAVTQGTPRPWGLEDLQPAELLSATTGQLAEMGPLILNQGTLTPKEI